jgi:ATP-dependent DNA helicase RecQ
MFKAGKSIDEIAVERSLAKSTIETHMLLSIKEGMLDVYEFVPRKKYDVIMEALLGKSFDSLAELKYLLNDEYSYNEIRAVMNHIRMEHEKKSGG